MITNILQHIYLIAALTNGGNETVAIYPPDQIDLKTEFGWIINVGRDAYANYPSNRVAIVDLAQEMGTNAVWGSREIIEVIDGPEEIERKERVAIFDAAIAMGFTWTNGWILGLSENDQTRFTSALAAANLMAEIYPASAVPVSISEKDGTPHTLTLPEYKDILRAYAIHYIALRNALKGTE